VRSLVGLTAAAGLLTSSAPSAQTPRIQVAPDVCRIRLDTTKGLVVIEVTRAWAPLGADRFLALVNAHYFDNSRLFRIIKDKWAQFGIAGDPAVAQAWRSKTIDDDPFIPAHSNVRGTIAFAFAVPNGRTTEVFINTRDNSATHDKEPFVPFGRVVSGMEVVDAWYSDYAETSGGGIRAGHQDQAFKEGNAFFDREFPKLDRIASAEQVDRQPQHKGA
jgi:peptidyl-prolyl cis-trans isomerase A (cyclophilin A)